KRAYCLKTQPATGETYPKSDLFNKAVQQLHQSLLAAGLKSALSVYTGGHDYAWWRGAIIDGLTDV
ncbi:hypothetical protein SJ359_26830, partial [Raoultella ornithinolytica]|uniref:hypothetical protein n=1 Tax=Raoultella ornithinolytica TaxID=54291 RepID=UPI0029D58E83